MDVLSPLLQALKSLVGFFLMLEWHKQIGSEQLTCTGSLDDESAVLPEDVRDILFSPHAGR